MSSNNEPGCRSPLHRRYFLILLNDNHWTSISLCLPEFSRSKALVLFSALCFCPISTRKRCLSGFWDLLSAFYFNAPIISLCLACRWFIQVWSCTIWTRTLIFVSDNIFRLSVFTSTIWFGYTYMHLRVKLYLLGTDIN